MAARRVTVVLSQSAVRDPASRALEEEVAAALLCEPTVELSIVPSLYDMPADHSGLLFLRSVPTHLVVLSWHYPRATRWLLERSGVAGIAGTTLLHPTNGDEEDEEADGAFEEAYADSASAPDSEASGLASGEPAGNGRRIYCLDLREPGRADAYVAEVRRIAAELALDTVPLALVPERPAAAPAPLPILPLTAIDPAQPSNGQGKLRRRWYPVIDYDRCTNCLECIDFCLFGVYGVDASEQILVEHQDNCKQGCPACSRVCPENAIIFPEYKAPAIAGAEVGGTGGIKIDLSLLFGGTGALQKAVVERDRELVQDGRQAVGMSAGIPRRMTRRNDAQRDELDELVDQLDRLEL